MFQEKRRFKMVFIDGSDYQLEEVEHLYKPLENEDVYNWFEAGYNVVQLANDMAANKDDYTEEEMEDTIEKMACYCSFCSSGNIFFDI